MREKLRTKRAQLRYHKRAHAAESAFGQVKGNLKFRALLRRGVEKARMEVALLFMLHSMLWMTAARARDKQPVMHERRCAQAPSDSFAAALSIA
jgi:hypothetical protein